MGEQHRGRVTVGMQAKTSDGERLGKVVSCQPNGIVVEKGFLFPKDLLVPYERITAVGDGEIVLAIARADLVEQGTARPAGNAPARAATSGPASTAMEDARGAARAILGREEQAKAGALDQFGKAGEICVPLVEEEIVAKKHVEKVGEVHVSKEVVTEERQITVPVTREVLHVERVSVSREVGEGSKCFEKESYDIPLREEHVTVEKHPVVREEVHVGKEIQQGEEVARATVRRERAEIETKGAVRRSGAPLAEPAAMQAAGKGGPSR